MDRVAREPRARIVFCDLLVRRRHPVIGLPRRQQRNDLATHKEMQDDVPKEDAGAHAHQRVALGAHVEGVPFLAVRFEGGAHGDESARDAQHVQRISVDLVRGEEARPNAPQDLVMVDDVDDAMAEGERQERAMGEAAGEEEHQGGQHGVEEQVGVAREVDHLREQELLRIVFPDVFVRADQKAEDLQGRIHRCERLDAERDQEGRRECVRQQVLAQAPLHGVCLKALGEVRDLRQTHAVVSLHVHANHH
mmetsp:Transcript_56106/g.162480  ORF Transcript_56106/g.162480 Transcript_56106/m.162480 type:complete len:250 (-) Transcript_56106:2191-2940(-)